MNAAGASARRRAHYAVMALDADAHALQENASNSHRIVDGLDAKLERGHVMNRIDKLFGLRGEARVRYMHGEYQVLAPGDFVRCAVSGTIIMLNDLRYWNVELQEPYASAEISMNRYIELRQKGRIRV